jgi:hypothetical protein
MSWFRRKSASSAAQLLQSPWPCVRCGGEHAGFVHLAAFAPDPWRGANAYEDNADLRMNGDFLSEDFCVMDGKYFFVRGVIEIPVHDMPDTFGFGCWSTLSRGNFDKYLHGFDDGEYPDMGPWSGWLCNQLFDFIGTKPEAMWAYPQLNRQRPRFRIQDAAHPLAIAQAAGVTADTVLEIFAHYGHAPAA